MNLNSLISLPARLGYLFSRGLWMAVMQGQSNRIARHLNLPKSVKIGRNVQILGKNITIGENSYMNSGYISSSPEGSVTIGRWCAIGYNVTILAVTHHPDFPTGPEKERPLLTGNIVIGDGCWIGNNVVILPGVRIGKQCVIGANAVVTHDVPDFAVAGGIPCRTLRLRTPEDLSRHSESINAT